LEIDRYMIQGQSIAGTELCIAGDQLRTKQSFLISQIVTDYSKCRIRKRGDEEVEICQPDAKSEVVVFDGHLTSPISYGVNVCLDYDKSHCRIRKRGDDQIEICQVDFNYEGLWAKGTIFEYRCTKSETQIQRHPLRYIIRYMAEIAAGEEIKRPKEKYRVTKSIPQCD
jgi:hypothetical protein